jgi:hypothetical protein
MAKIKIAYEWIGPTGPISNNRVPNIYDLAIGSECVRFDDSSRQLGNSAYLYSTLFRHFPDIFEISSVYELKEDDLFVYDFQLHHRNSFIDFFAYGASHGLIENSNFSGKLKHYFTHGNGYLLLDMSLESFVSNGIFFQMHNYFKAHGIPLNKVIYQTGCPNVQEIYDNYCGMSHADDKMNVLFWDSFEYQMSQSYQAREYKTNRNIDTIKKIFLSLNYRYRPHRNDLTLLFYKNDLLKDSYFSMPSHNPDLDSQQFLERVDQNFASYIGLNIDELNYLQHNILPLTVDALATDRNEHRKMTMDAEQSLSHLYETSMISVVTETLAYEEAIAETEKTFKPIIYKQPFILVGQAGSLKNLKNKGYKTFSKWFDESYDDIIDNRVRLIKITETCKEISLWDYNKKKAFIDETKEIVDHNYTNFKNIYGNILPDFWSRLHKQYNF